MRRLARADARAGTLTAWFDRRDSARLIWEESRERNVVHVARFGARGLRPAMTRAISAYASLLSADLAGGHLELLLAPRSRTVLVRTTPRPGGRSRGVLRARLFGCCDLGMLGRRAHTLLFDDNHRTLYAAVRRSASFTRPQVLASARKGFVSYQTTTALAGNGRALAAWTSSPSGGRDPTLHITQLQAGARRWHKPRPIVGARPAPMSPAVALQAGGSGVIAWAGFGCRTLRITVVRDGQLRSTHVVRLRRTAPCWWPDVRVAATAEASGTFAVAWSDGPVVHVRRVSAG